MANRDFLSFLLGPSLYGSFPSRSELFGSYSSPLPPRFNTFWQQLYAQRMAEAQQNPVQRALSGIFKPPAQPAPQPAPTAPSTSQPGASPTPSSGRGGQVLAAGSKYLGRPYVMGGGRGTTENFDCSAFVARAYADLGVRLTPFTDKMFTETAPVQSEPQVGDLVFFKFNDPSQPGVQYPHVAIYAGGMNVLDASSGTGKVSLRPMTGIPGQRIFRRVP